MNKYSSLLILAMTLAACAGNTDKQATAEVKEVSWPAAIDKGDLEFGKYFSDKTMRLDYFHSGTASEEHFAVDRVLSDGAWSGSRTILTDRLDMGLYFFEVVDRDSRELLFSRGFASIFGEWQTIPEAAQKWGTFHESLRFPWPLRPVTVILKKRNALNVFETIWTTDVDPSSRQVNSADLVHTNKVDVLLENGPASAKVDLVLLGDGYAANEMEKFRADAKRLAEDLLNAEPFKSHRTDFNVRAIETPSEVSGVNKPHHGVFKRTALSVHYSSFDSERYALSYDNRMIRDVASQVPYDIMVIIVNEQTYGGGGIYNLYTTVAADNKFSEYIMVHEMGHHLAALADEYYTSSVSYEVPEVKVEPWEKNITALFDKDKLKWNDLVDPATPLPTPWNKEVFDSRGYAIQKERDSLRKALVPESVMEDLFIRQMRGEDELFNAEKFRDNTGAFEGAGYLAKGLYRPQVDCIMYTRHMKFCSVCNRTIVSVIEQYTR